jgi:hypothetical protein
MSLQDLDLRAYNLLLEDIRNRLVVALTGTISAKTEPTYHLDEYLSAKIHELSNLQLQLNYTALKLKNLKEDIGTFPQGLPR